MASNGVGVGGGGGDRGGKGGAVLCQRTSAFSFILVGRNLCVGRNLWAKGKFTSLLWKSGATSLLALRPERSIPCCPTSSLILPFWSHQQSDHDCASGERGRRIYTFPFDARDHRTPGRMQPLSRLRINTSNAETKREKKEGEKLFPRWTKFPISAAAINELQYW